MSEKKEQKIVVLTSLTPDDKNLILSGIKLATVFKKTICFAYLLSKKTKALKPHIEEELNRYARPVNQEIPTLITSIAVLQATFRNLPAVLADEHEAIMLIASATQFRTYARAVPSSPIPFLFIHPECPPVSLNHIILPVDLRKENSDAMLWSSWFGRFAKSNITIIAASEKSRDSQQLVHHNILLAKKLFQKFNVSHRIIKGEKGSFRNSFEAMEYARESDTDLVILLGSSFITPLDRLIGLPERKIISNEKNLPVLLINPRIDNYMLCD